MNHLPLREFHQKSSARFIEVNDLEVAGSYQSVDQEYAALRNSIGLLDLGFRSRLCVLGPDRQRFLHGQVTNDVNRLKIDDGCYAALVNAKGRIQSDLNIYVLAEEILLDFEPGLTASVQARLEEYIIADDVQVADVLPHYGLLSLQGPKAKEAVERLEMFSPIPGDPFHVAETGHSSGSRIYLMNQPRLFTTGFDLFVPNDELVKIMDRLTPAVKSLGGALCGFEALEIARIEAGIPRYGQDMDESNLAPETGIGSRAISYNKGCYIGQEVIARIRTYGQVAKALRGLRFEDGLEMLPQNGDPLSVDGKAAGYVTSVATVPSSQMNIGLGYVRREYNDCGTHLTVESAAGKSKAEIISVPFLD